ncbi:TPA: hypothetical protein SUU18_002046, partial [Streptococcus equi subsp. equi]|nr:hypothetical protein [Streptococcus equi subsp. equi]
KRIFFFSVVALTILTISDQKVNASQYRWRQYYYRMSPTERELKKEKEVLRNFIATIKLSYSEANEMEAKVYGADSFSKLRAIKEELQSLKSRYFKISNKVEIVSSLIDEHFPEGHSRNIMKKYRLEFLDRLMGIQYDVGLNKDRALDDLSERIIMTRKKLWYI